MTESTETPLALAERTPEKRKELVALLADTAYRGKSAHMVGLVVDYCWAANIDPMLKVVHIVSVWDSKTNSYVDDIWPSVDLYRLRASRSGSYAGMDAPIYGPTVTKTFHGRRKNYKTKQWEDYQVTTEYPEWCELTIYRMVQGVRCSWTHRELWVENYAKAGAGECPNSMWAGRPFGQITKCTESQCLRRAFQELTSGPTAEEMAGKPIGDTVYTDETTEVYAPIRQPEAKAPEPAKEPEIIDQQFTEQGTPDPDPKPAMTPAPAPAPEDSGELAGAGAKTWLEKRAGDELGALLEKHGTSMNTLTAQQFKTIRSEITRTTVAGAAA